MQFAYFNNEYSDFLRECVSTACMFSNKHTRIYMSTNTHTHTRTHTLARAHTQTQHEEELHNTKPDFAFAVNLLQTLPAAGVFGC